MGKHATIEKELGKADMPSAAERAAPVMKSTALGWQSEGYHWREALVRLPAGIMFQDLLDATSGIWKSIQSTPQTTLRCLDRVTCVAFDQTWAVKDAMVVHADATCVVLAIKHSDRITLPNHAAGQV